MPRINRDNVFLSEEAPAGQFILKAMDHTHCFSCGRPLTRKLSQIDTIRDRRLFGRFPAFAPYMQRAKVEQAISDLRKIGVDVVQSMMRTIPREWDVPSNVQDALTDLILGRAAFVADNICGKLWPQGELPFEEAEDVT